jgi:excisionase family DNA binding protein
MQFMTMAQIAEHLRVGERRVKQMISSGKLAAHASGGVWEVDRRELDSLAETIRQARRAAQAQE